MIFRTDHLECAIIGLEVSSLNQRVVVLILPKIQPAKSNNVLAVNCDSITNEK